MGWIVRYPDGTEIEFLESTYLDVEGNGTEIKKAANIPKAMAFIPHTVGATFIWSGAVREHRKND